MPLPSLEVGPMFGKTTRDAASSQLHVPSVFPCFHWASLDQEAISSVGKID